MIRPSRRTVLRSAFASLALPFLPSLLPRDARAAETPPVRSVFLYVPNGMWMADWTPGGASHVDSPILRPLASVASRVNVLTGLSQAAGVADRAGDHARGTGCFLTATPVKYTAGNDIENGISVDQVMASATGSATPFASIQLGMDGGSSTGDCDSGYSCAYARNISWAGPQTPLPNLTDPQLLFERMFPAADQVTQEEVERQTLMRTSVLDYVLDQANDLKRRLGRDDGRKLDDYMTGVRQVEGRIEELAEQICIPGVEPEVEDDVELRVQTMLDLIALGMECDVSRIFTFMLADAGSNRSFEFLGYPGAHHEYSHHGDSADNLAALRAIGAWEVAQLAYLLERLAERTESDGSDLLDNTLVYFSSEIEDGDTHAHENMPVVLAGGGGGAVRTGRHLVYTDREPMADLFVAMLQAHGVAAGSFGMDGTRPLAGLT
jgi:hypothetical protein